MFPLKNVARKGLNQMEWNLKPGRPMWPETSSMNFKISMVWETWDFSDSWVTCILSYLPLLCHLRWISLLFLQKVTCVGLAMHVLMIYPIFCMVWTWALSDANSGSTCKPFVIDRHDSICAEALAAGSYPKCSSLKAMVERGFCEMSSLDDLDTLLNVARVLGHNDASIQIHVAIYIIWVIFEWSSRKIMNLCLL